MITSCSKVFPSIVIEPNIVASISKKQLEDIANQKMADLNAIDIEQAIKIIAGSARSMGIEVKE